MRAEFCLHGKSPADTLSVRLLAWLSAWLSAGCRFACCLLLSAFFVSGQIAAQQLPSAQAPPPGEIPSVDANVVTGESATTKNEGWLRNLFTSVRARREKWLDNEDYQSLAADTGDTSWSAAAQYRQGDLPAAIESFSALPGESALYNHATALAHSGDYQQSLDQYDRLLQQNPQHADALFNREIVEKLMQQQQQQQQQQGDGEQGDQQQDQQQQQDSESDNSEQQQSSDSQQQSEESASESEQQPGDEGQTSEPDLQELEQAQQPEAQQQSQDQLEQQRQQALRELAEEPPLNEQQQATEQWLRQIPDDPSGLLRRKLERSHVNDYPGVTSSKQPW